MATLTGQVYSYSNTVPQRRTLTDRIILASPYDVTTILRLGLDNVSKFRMRNWPNRTYEWLEDTYPSRSTTLNDATNITNSTTTTTIAVNNVARFQVGDVVQLDDEYVHVSSIAAGVLTVVRGFGGTTQATHESTATAYIRFTARLEGADSSDSPTEEVTSTTNNSQIFHKEIKISRSAQDIPVYGMGDPWDYEMNKKMDVLMEELERVPFYGLRAVGTTTTARAAGGFRQFVSTNATDKSSAAFVRKDIDDLVEDCWDNGGMPNLIFTGAWGKRKLNSLYEGFVRTERSEKIGGIVIDVLTHPLTGADIEIIVDRHCATTDMWIMDERYIGYLQWKAFAFEPLAKDGDYDRGQVIGEYGFVTAHEKAHARLYNFSLTA